MGCAEPCHLSVLNQDHSHVWFHGISTAAGHNFAVHLRGPAAVRVGRYGSPVITMILCTTVLTHRVSSPPVSSTSVSSALYSPAYMSRSCPCIAARRQPPTAGAPKSTLLVRHTRSPQRHHDNLAQQVKGNTRLVYLLRAQISLSHEMGRD